MKRLLFVFIYLWLFWPVSTLAAGIGCEFDNYITTFNLNEDSSVSVTEKIDLVCQDYNGMHGIYRVLPTVAARPDDNYKSTKVRLVSITDAEGNTYDYSATNYSDTVQYKIGDTDITIDQPATYIIKYEVQNAIFYSSELGKDVFNWNVQSFLNDYATNNVAIEVNFPVGLDEQNVHTNLYSGYASSEANPSQENPYAEMFWSENKLNIFNTSALGVEQGITLFATFDSGIFTYYQPTFWEQYSLLFQILIALIIPIFVGRYLYGIWRKYGDDPDVVGSIAPAFAPPKKLRPLELGILQKATPTVDNQLITATLIDLAVRGFITIEEVKKGPFKTKDWIIKLNTKAKPKIKQLRPFEQEFLNIILSDSKLKDNDGNQIMGVENYLSDSMKSYAKSTNAVAKKAFDTLKEEGLVDKEGKKYQAIFLGIGIFLLIISFQILFFVPSIGFAMLTSGILLVVFGAIMPRRTEEGSFLYHESKGFQLYMKTAEKYRQQFFEKENIFEKYLPYAIGFGIVSQWKKAVEKLYPKQMKNYHPVWYVGSSNFSVSSFTSSINSISSSVSSSVASSGSGGVSGGGFSGGGGGGGGAGGW